MLVWSSAYPTSVFFDLGKYTASMALTSMFSEMACTTHLVQARPNVGADDELDALDLGLDKHDTEMLILRGVGVRTQELHVVGLELNVVNMSLLGKES